MQVLHPYVPNGHRNILDTKDRGHGSEGTFPTPLSPSNALDIRGKRHVDTDVYDVTQHCSII